MTDELTSDDAPEWTAGDFARAEIRKGSEIIRPERKRDELTLREKVMAVVGDYHRLDEAQVVDAIAALLEDTGSPAHMRVAVELRGE